jgi:hypothetical protein
MKRNTLKPAVPCDAKSRHYDNNSGPKNQAKPDYVQWIDLLGQK